MRLFLCMNFFMVSAADERTVIKVDEEHSIISRLNGLGYTDLVKAIEAFKHPSLNHKSFSIPLSIIWIDVTTPSIFDFNNNPSLWRDLENGYMKKRIEKANNLGGNSHAKLAYCDTLDRKKEEYVVKGYDEPISQACMHFSRVINAKRMQCLIRDLGIVSIKIPDKYIITNGASFYIAQKRVSDKDRPYCMSLSEVNNLEFNALNELAGLHDLHSGNWHVHNGILYLYDLEDSAFRNSENCLISNSYYDPKIASNCNLEKAKQQAIYYNKYDLHDDESISQSTSDFFKKVAQAKVYIAKKIPYAQKNDAKARRKQLFEDFKGKLAQGRLYTDIIKINDPREVVKYRIEERQKMRESGRTKESSREFGVRLAAEIKKQKDLDAQINNEMGNIQARRKELCDKIDREIAEKCLNHSVEAMIQKRQKMRESGRTKESSREFGVRLVKQIKKQRL